jgi:hypothetical protein
VFDAQAAGATEQQLQNIAAEGLQAVGVDVNTA